MKRPQPRRLARANELRFGATCQVEEEREMAVPHALGTAGSLQPVAAVLTHRLEKPISSSSRSRVLDDHQRLVDEMRQQIQHVVLLDAVARADILRRFETPSTGKDRELAQQPAFGLREQVVAPVNRGLERALPGDRRPAPAREQPESIFQPDVDLLH